MKLLKKELKLATSPLSWFFVLFGLMALIPGYPILLGAFFTCLGIFQSIQETRDSNDILYSALLPIAKRDVVKAKYTAALLFELLSFTLSALCTALRLTMLRDAEVYVQNALMAANFRYLAFDLLIFALFNAIFLRGFFRTAYRFGVPFICFGAAAFVVVGVAEALHHFPGLGWLNAWTGKDLLRQLPLLFLAVILFIGITYFSMKASQRSFEEIDLN